MFKIDILTRDYCGGAVKVIASVEAPIMVKIEVSLLRHLKLLESVNKCSSNVVLVY